jgi:hypothetical protein
MGSIPYTLLQVLSLIDGSSVRSRSSQPKLSFGCGIREREVEVEAELAAEEE